MVTCKGEWGHYLAKLHSKAVHERNALRKVKVLEPMHGNPRVDMRVSDPFPQYICAIKWVTNYLAKT